MNKRELQHAWNKLKPKWKKHFLSLVLIRVLLISPVWTNTSDMKQAKTTLSWFFVFVCLSHVCERPFFMLVFVLILQVWTANQIFRVTKTPRRLRKDCGKLYAKIFVIYYQAKFFVFFCCCWVSVDIVTRSFCCLLCFGMFRICWEVRYNPKRCVFYHNCI